jgi:hypothetical protein
VALGVCGWPLPHFESPPVFDQTRLYRWTHVAVVYDHATLCTKLYVDGELMKESQIQRHVPISIGPARIGHWNVGPCRNLHGRIAELVVLGRALNGEEIGWLYEAGRPASRLNTTVPSSEE